MKNDIKLMKLIIAALFVSSFSMVFSIFSDYNGNGAEVVFAFIGSGLFWLCLILGYCLLGIVSKHRKAYGLTFKGNHFRNGDKELPGAVKFFSNRFAMIADIAMVFFLIITLIFIFIPSMNQDVAVVFVAVLIFTIHMHGILNGVNFTYINSLIKKGE